MKWVATQAVLFALLLFWPGQHDFALPEAALILSWALSVVGALLLMRAIYDLRKFLAVAPAPRKDGRLQTKGVYSHIRHPMYSSVWLILGSLSVRSESYWKIALFVLIVVFFIVKTRHEESLLKVKYKNYEDYMKHTGAYWPKVKKRGK